MVESMSVWGLIVGATLPVKFVMLLLLLISMLSWVMIFQRNSVLVGARNARRPFEDRFWSGSELSQLYSQVNRTPDSNSGLESIFRAGFKEFARMQKSGITDSEAVMDGAQRAMRVALSREQEKLETNLSFLATVGSTSPYVGLLGTVYGIMNAFLGLAGQSQATLAVVAPGIAEALIATALGLLAAIPAVVGYNRFAAMSESLLNSYEIFADEFASILHRQAHAT